MIKVPILACCLKSITRYVLKVSVIVVSFNTKALLRDCLGALADVDEAIVVDNASIDGSADMVADEFPQVGLIRNETNVGFGRANNQGLRVARNEFVLLLNSDARPSEGAIESMIDVLSDPQIVAAGGRLLNSDGSLQESCGTNLTLWRVLCEQLFLEKLFPRSTAFNSYWTSSRILASGRDEHEEVEQVMGACLMMRKGALFDERFPLYCEDTDLCLRLRKIGKIVYVPKAEFVHALGSSSSAERWRSVALYNRGKELYFAVHGGVVHWLVTLLLNRLGAALRLVVGVLAMVATFGTSNQARRKVATFAKVLVAPIRGPRLA
jgi:N-acetylglucosaminyl-diphospho-decaprenol L-rhamnosyltransferase